MEEFVVHLGGATQLTEGEKNGIRISNSFCWLKYCRCVTVKKENQTHINEVSVLSF